MTITRAQALRLLEPFWLAREASEARLQSMLDEILKEGTREALHHAEALQQAGNYLREKARRFEPAFLRQAIQDPHGAVLLFPEVRLADADLDAVVSRWRRGSEREPAKPSAGVAP